MPGVPGKTGRKISLVSGLHYVRLVYRSVLFLLLLIAYIRFRFWSGKAVTDQVESMPAILYVVWAVFVLEMILRFFPSRYESPGCQKQFARNYIKSGSTDIVIPYNNSTVLVALVWIVFNGMMFTPLFFVRRAYSWSLLALSVALLVRWEITFYLHPERFSEKTNDYLQCRNCTEKLCVHKKQLKTLWLQVEEYTSERIKRLKK